MNNENNISPAPIQQLVGRPHHDHACALLRDVLSCWCAGIPMDQRRVIRDMAIKYLAAADTDDCVVNINTSRMCERGTAGCHIRHRDASSGWIPVSDRLPPTNTAVIVCCMVTDDGEGPWIGSGFYIKEGWQSQDSVMLDLPIAFEVTHWMPMPLPPNTPHHRPAAPAQSPGQPGQEPTQGHP
jgi:hypothetical protein